MLLLSILIHLNNGRKRKKCILRESNEDRFASTVTRVYRAFVSTDQEKRETARSLSFSAPLLVAYIYIYIYIYFFFFRGGLDHVVGWRLSTDADLYNISEKGFLL